MSFQGSRRLLFIGTQLQFTVTNRCVHHLNPSQYDYLVSCDVRQLCAILKVTASPPRIKGEREREMTVFQSRQELINTVHTKSTRPTSQAFCPYKLLYVLCDLEKHKACILVTFILVETEKCQAGVDGWENTVSVFGDHFTIRSQTLLAASTEVIIVQNDPF